jgi:hypothetical protein
MGEKRRRGRIAAAIVAVAAVVLTASAAAARPPNHRTTNVTAYVTPHRPLPYNPVLHAGETVHIAVTGFASRATVTVQLVKTSYRNHIRADGHGVARAIYVVRPGRAGDHYLITFQGQPNIASRVQPRATGPVQPSGSADQQTITATVPRIGLFPYRLAGGHGSGGSGVEGVSIHEPVDDPGSGLAVTGADIAGVLALGLAACLAGVLALRAGRRRRRS